jgi:mono/diheme cytochrome c family protein
MNKLILFLSLILFYNCEYSKPPLEFFPDMYDSPAVEAQELDSYYNPYGRRIPPEGTIPVNYYPYPYSDVPTPDELKNPEKGLSNPFKAGEKADLKRGESRYQIYCSPCHGVSGYGNGPVVGPSPRFPAPVPNLFDNASKWTDGQLYHIITMGRGRMSSYANQVEPDDRWKLILYVRKLQEAHAKGN